MVTAGLSIGGPVKLAKLNATLACHLFFAEVGLDYHWNHMPNFTRVRLVHVDYNVASEYFSVLVRNLNTGIPTRYREVNSREHHSQNRLWVEVYPYLDKEGSAFVDEKNETRFQIRGIDFDNIDVSDVTNRD
jgi:hypothetical protein